MKTQPEPLRLADSAHLGYRVGWQRQAAAELRRLQAQRDALLEALKRMALIIDAMGDMPDGFIHPSPWRTLQCEEALTQARAAIKTAEETK